MEWCSVQHTQCLYLQTCALKMSEASPSAFHHAKVLPSHLYHDVFAICRNIVRFQPLPNINSQEGPLWSSSSVPFSWLACSAISINIFWCKSFLKFSFLVHWSFSPVATCKGGQECFSAFGQQYFIYLFICQVHIR